jgi:hypothetical protein
MVSYAHGGSYIDWQNRRQTRMKAKVEESEVIFSLCLIKHHAMKTVGRVEVQLHAFLTLALGGGECLASCSGRFTPGVGKTRKLSGK